MQIVEFTSDSLRFADAVPSAPPAEGFVWVFLDRDEFEEQRGFLQKAALQIGGSALLDLHCMDLCNPAHPSHYDFTSVYDLIIFRRLATPGDTPQPPEREPSGAAAADAEAASGIRVRKTRSDRRRRRRGEAAIAVRRIESRAVGFAIFDRLLISVHPKGCYTARTFIERFLSDARFTADATSARNRIPSLPADLALRMVNVMVDSYLALRKQLSQQLDHWQAALLDARSPFNNWGALMAARSQLHVLEDLCDEQRDAVQEWLDSLREQPVALPDALPGGGATYLSQAQHDQLVARARDVIEHIERVMHHARRLEQAAETVVQIHFSALGNRTNDVMRTLTVLTAVFLPLNLIAGIFGMNFDSLPLIHETGGVWWALGGMAATAAALFGYFWRKRYIARG